MDYIWVKTVFNINLRQLSIKRSLFNCLFHNFLFVFVATVADGREINRMFLTVFAINSLAT